MASRTDIANEIPLSENSFTSDYILKIADQLLKTLQDPQITRWLANIKADQQLRAEQLVAQTTACPVPTLTSVREHISGLRANELKNVTIEQFYNPEAMAATLCTVDSIFYTSPYDVGSIHLNSRARLYIHNLRQIGAPSAEGYAMLGDFDKAKDFFVVKVSRDVEDDSLLHELIIGIYGTNKLRRHVPNFSYIYGGFKCAPPLIDPESKKVVAWCLHNENPVNYVLYENIAPAVNMDSFVATCTGKEFVNAYLQIVYALRLGVRLIDFTHFDLHHKNVLIRTLPTFGQRNFQIAYETERGIEYITTNFISTIIDYGFSHILVPDVRDQSGNIIMSEQHFGRSGFMSYSIYPYRSWIMHDLYKLLMFCLQMAINKNNTEVILEATKIFRFFNQIEDPISAIAAQRVNFFFFPLTSSTETLSIDDFARHIRSGCDCDFISPNRSSDPVLDCERLCPTEAAILSQIGVDSKGTPSVPDNIIEFYDIILWLYDQGRETDRAYVATTFLYREAMIKHIRSMEAIMRELRNLHRQLKLINITQMTHDQILNYNTMALVRSMYITVAAMIDRLTELTFYYNVGIVVAQLYQDTESIAILNNTMAELNHSINLALKEAKVIILDNNTTLDNMIIDTTVTQARKRDPKLNWYWDGRRLFNIVLGPLLK